MRASHNVYWDLTQQRQGFIPAAVALYINQFSVHNLCGSVPNIVHSPNPRHLVGCFELFGHTFTLCHLFHQPREHFPCLPVNIRKTAIQLAACQQSGVHPSVMLFQITFVSLSTYTDRLCFFFVSR